MRWVRRWWRAFSEDSGPANALGLAVIGVVTIALGLVDLWTDAPWGGPAADLSVAWHLVPLAAGCAGVLLRRTRPGTALAVAVLAFVADAVIGGSLALLLVLFDGMFSAERFGSSRLRRGVRFGAGVLTVGTLVAGLLGGLGMRSTTLLTLQTAGLLLIPLWWARDVRLRTELAEAAQARADLEALRAREQARALAAEQRGAVQAERTRMAQELHDAVAGDVSALVIRAGAALAAPPGPSDRACIAAVRESGLHALGELRSMIEVLTADTPAGPVAPTLTDDGAALLHRHAAMLDGVPPADLGALPLAVDQAGFRILQEALTNAARHGREGSTRVALSRDGGALELRVRNAVDPAAVREGGGGLGLTSMGERARAVGGELELAREDGAWVVAARLPVGSS